MSKPIWALMVMNAEDLERQAATIRQEAEGKRCPEVESGGVQCTLNRGHVGRCMIRDQDMP